MSNKKIWVTPAIEEASVQITEGGSRDKTERIRKNGKFSKGSPVAGS